MKGHIDFLEDQVSKKLVNTTIFSIFACVACAPIGDSAFLIRGSLLYEDQVPYKNCIIETMQGQEIVAKNKIYGEFDETIVFHPKIVNEPLRLIFDCVGAAEKFIYEVDRIPRPFGKYIEIGEIEIKRLN